MARQARTSPELLEIGDWISCRYTATTSGAIGTFSELGTTTASAIPVASSATPDGSFNFIYVGDDAQGKKILVADRNVQKSISWDIINNKGMTNTGCEITF